MKSYKNRLNPQEMNGGMKNAGSTYKGKMKQDLNGYNKKQELAKNYIRK